MKIKQLLALLLLMITICVPVFSAYGLERSLPENDLILPQYVVARSIYPTIVIENGKVVGTTTVIVRQNCRIVFDLDIQKSSNNVNWSTCLNSPAVSVTTSTLHQETCEYESLQSKNYYRLKANIKIYVNDILKDSDTLYTESVYYS